MPKTIKTKVYLYSELKDESAKDRARQWFIDLTTSDDISDNIINEDAKNVFLKIPEWDLYRRTVKAEFMVDADKTALAIIQEHGDMCETYKTAMGYLKSCYDLLKLGKSSPENETEEDLEYWYSTCLEDVEAQFLSDIGYDYLHMLEKEWEHMCSEEYLADCFEANEYTFTAEGKRFG